MTARVKGCKLSAVLAPACPPRSPRAFAGLARFSRRAIRAALAQTRQTECESLHAASPKPVSLRDLCARGRPPQAHAFCARHAGPPCCAARTPCRASRGSLTLAWATPLRRGTPRLRLRPSCPMHMPPPQVRRCGAQAFRAWLLRLTRRASLRNAAGLVPPSALKGDAMLRLRALCNEKVRAARRLSRAQRTPRTPCADPASQCALRPQELELLELRGEHNQLIARFAEARANMEEALEARRCAGDVNEACAHAALRSAGEGPHHRRAGVRAGCSRRSAGAQLFEHCVA